MYKKVAMVEQFFDIIYSVHVEAASVAMPSLTGGMDGTATALQTAVASLRGRADKHCGQKRTYRAVADQYAFIPR